MILTKVPKPFNEERTMFYKWYGENWVPTCKTVKLDTYLTPYTKNNSKYIKDLNVRPKNLKLLEENIGGNLHDIGSGNDFLDMIPKAQVTRTEIDKLEFMKIENLYASER